MDNFYEQLVSTEKPAKYTLAKTMVYVLVALALASSFIGQMLLSILFLALAGGLFFIKKNFFLEYEYVFTNGEIDIDKIFEMKSRKRAITFSIKEIELLAIENSDAVKNFSNKPSKILSLFPENTKSKIYVAMVTGGAERVQIRFTPDEKFIECCFKYNPKAVKRNNF